ncbi:MAG TPA: alpha-amylase family glycosyl hydrolase [Chloroflexota bacterium]
MIDKHQDSPAGETSSFANDIATAPGDLPASEVAARYQTLKWQFRHDNTIAPAAPQPGEPVEVVATTGADMHLQRATLFYTTDGSHPGTDSPAIPMESGDVEWDSRAGFLTQWRATIPGQPDGTVVRYRLGGWLAGVPKAAERGPDEWANDGQGFWFRFPGEKGITTFAYLAEPLGQPMPDWMADAVIYHIFLDRFHPGTPDGAFTGPTGPRERHGGTLAGVRQALPYLADLGVTCLWFSPLGPSETYHRYDTIDYFDVDPALGTADELRELIRDAHAASMRVWLDFVPSHSSWRHPAFEAARRDRSAPTFSWFTFDEWPDSYRSFMQAARYLPSLNTNDPGARGHLVDAASYWLREFAVDGYRLDHAIAPSMDFWVALRAAAQAVKADVVLVGEATDTPDSLRRYRGKLHGILDFPLANALRLAFGAQAWSVDRLDQFLETYERYMAQGPGRVSFLDNHDMDRFLWVAGNDERRLTMAAVCQFTLDATPVIYYGTEIGMTQLSGSGQLGFGGDAEARRDMPWDRNAWDQELLAFYRRLIHLRRDEPGLHSGDRRTVHLDSEVATYAYLRTPPEGSRILTAFNMSEEERVVRVHLPDEPDQPDCLITTGAAPELRVSRQGLEIGLAPMTAAILRV